MGAEDRCLAAAHWLRQNGRADFELYGIRIDDRPSKFTAEVEGRTDEIDRKLRSLSPFAEYSRGDILSEPNAWIPILGSVAKCGSVVLDISGMPKRVFLFALKYLLASPAIENLVIIYSRPEAYPEGALSEAALPSSFIPGFAREADHSPESLFVVGVGYVAFNLEDLLEQKRGKEIKFLMPFPPGSPAARRNWNLLKRLYPQAGGDTEIRRVHNADAFEVMRWVRSVADVFSGSIDLIPLGPKPHAVGMALAHLAIGERCQITYAQPTTYRADYSLGVGTRSDGTLDAYAYCLKLGGRDVMDFLGRE